MYAHINNPLTAREIEILSLVAQGKSRDEIAETLGISRHTAHRHIANILKKLHMDNRTQAAVFAVVKGWLKLKAKDLITSSS